MVEVVPVADLSPDQLVVRLNCPRDAWPNSCLVALSSDVRLLATAYGTELVVASLEGGVVTTFQVVERPTSRHALITQLLVFSLADKPVLASVGSAAPGGPRLRTRGHASRVASLPSNIVCIGDLTGYVRFFGPDGRLLLAHRLHTTAVVQMHVRPHAASASSSSPDEDLTILFEDKVVVVISGASLYRVLHAKMAAETGSAAPAMSTAHKDTRGADAGDGLSLEYHKWLLVGPDGDQVVDDVVSCAFVRSQRFDVHRARTAQVHLLGVGSFPMVAFYAPSDEQGTGFSTAVALASNMASKLTTAVFSFAKTWWASGSTEEPTAADVARAEANADDEESDAKVQEPIDLALRWSLRDPARCVTSILVSPDNDLAVTCDAFGRVMLLDMTAYVIVRMWKGYREAQCGWIQQDRGQQAGPVSKGDAGATAPRAPPPLLFLAIYAPRRGILEVWRMRHGTRQLFLHVGRDCCLLPSSPGLSGPPQFSRSEPGRRTVPPTAASVCHVMHRLTGKVQRIGYSYVLASQRRQDRVLVQRLRQLLSEESMGADQGEHARTWSDANDLVHRLRFGTSMVEAGHWLCQHDHLDAERVHALLQHIHARMDAAVGSSSGGGKRAAAVATDGITATVSQERELSRLVTRVHVFLCFARVTDRSGSVGDDSGSVSSEQSMPDFLVKTLGAHVSGGTEAAAEVLQRWPQSASGDHLTQQRVAKATQQLSTPMSLPKFVSCWVSAASPDDETTSRFRLLRTSPPLALCRLLFQSLQGGRVAAMDPLHEHVHPDSLLRLWLQWMESLGPEELNNVLPDPVLAFLRPIPDALSACSPAEEPLPSLVGARLRAILLTSRNAAGIAAIVAALRQAWSPAFPALEPVLASWFERGATLLVVSSHVPLALAPLLPPAGLSLTTLSGSASVANLLAWDVYQEVDDEAAALCLGFPRIADKNRVIHRCFRALLRDPHLAVLVSAVDVIAVHRADRRLAVWSQVLTWSRQRQASRSDSAAGSGGNDGDGALSPSAGEESPAGGDSEAPMADSMGSTWLNGAATEMTHIHDPSLVAGASVHLWQHRVLPIFGRCIQLLEHSRKRPTDRLTLSAVGVSAAGFEAILAQCFQFLTDCMNHVESAAEVDHFVTHVHHLYEHDDSNATGTTVDAGASPCDPIVGDALCDTLMIDVVALQRDHLFPSKGDVVLTRLRALALLADVALQLTRHNLRGIQLSQMWSPADWPLSREEQEQQPQPQLKTPDPSGVQTIMERASSAFRAPTLSPFRSSSDASGDTEARARMARTEFLVKLVPFDAPKALLLAEPLDLDAAEIRANMDAILAQAKQRQRQ